MSDIKDDIIYKAALTFKHEELAGMYAICNKREQELREENTRLKEDLLLTRDQLRDAAELLETLPVNRLNAKYIMLKELLLLTHPSVSDTLMNELTIKQWNEFIKAFPDEGG